MPLIPGICSLSGNNKRNWDLQRNRIMIEYVKMNDDNMDCVIKKYIEYYNNVENGCWSYEKAYKRIHQVMTMEGSLCYSERQKSLFLAFAAPILRCVKRSIYLCKIVRIPRRGYSKRQIILSFTISSI